MLDLLAISKSCGSFVLRIFTFHWAMRYLKSFVFEVLDEVRVA